MHELNSRIEALEASNRRLRNCSLVAIFAWIGAPLLMGSASEDTKQSTQDRVIECGQLIVRGKLNSVAVGPDKNGYVGITVHDGAGNARILLHVDERGSGVILTDNELRKRVSLAAFKSETGQAAALQVWGSSNKHLALVGQSNDKPSIQLTDGMQTRVSIGSTSLPASGAAPETTTSIDAIVLTDSTGRITFQAPNAAPASQAK